MPVVKIIGGHGHVALALARLLGRRPDFEVVSLIRNPDHEADVASTGAIPVLFDLEHASVADFVSKLSGADFVVWSAGAGGKGGAERTYAIDRDAAIRSMQAARQVGGITRYIMVSYLGSNLASQMSQSDPLYNYGQAKRAADQYLINRSGLDFTIVNPGPLNHNAGSGNVDFNVTPAQIQGRSISRSNVALILEAIITNQDVAKRVLSKEVPCLDGDVPIVEGLNARFD